MLVSEKRNIRSRMGGIAVYNEQQEAIHNGRAFSYDSEGTIAAGESVYLLGVTGDYQVHFDTLSGLFEAGGIRVGLYSAPTVTSNGTEHTPVNMNFASSNVSSMALYSGPTVTDIGTFKAQMFLPATGVGVNIQPTVGGIAGGRVLAANTSYIIKIENTLDTGTTDFGLTFEWHESDVEL